MGGGACNGGKITPLNRGGGGGGRNSEQGVTARQYGTGIFTLHMCSRVKLTPMELFYIVVHGVGTVL